MATTPRDLLGRTCNYECTREAEFFVKDGNVGDLACARHLIDAVETAVKESDLTVDDNALKVFALREGEA